MVLDPVKAMKITLAMLGVAVLLRGSLIAFLLAAAAAVPSGYVMWVGSQEEGQKLYAYGLLLLLLSLLLTALMLLAWLR
jgi:hypothetical protein